MGDECCDFKATGSSAKAKFTFNADHTYTATSATAKSYSTSIQACPGAEIESQNVLLAGQYSDDDSDNDSTDNASDDGTYCPSAENDTDSDSSNTNSESDDEQEESKKENTDSAGDEKTIFLVYLSELVKLLKYCPSCGSSITSLHKTTVGTMLTVGISCISECNQKWRSQPMLHHMPAGNLALSSSILLSGGTYAQVSRMMKIMHSPCISRSQYNRIQATYLCPVIDKFWVNHQEAILSVLSENPISVCGDARSDSPGFSAKYSSYSLMDLDSKLIIDQQLVQVTETGSSVKMEKLGLERSLQFVTESGVTIKVLATDRHLGIQAFMKSEYPQIDHQFDVWHLAKSVKKN